jgi:hypothetical protein
MPAPPEFSRFTLMDQEEIQTALCLSIKLNLHRLPQLKGKGKIVGAGARDQSVDFFCAHVVAHLLQSNIVLLKGPPLGNHSTGGM